MGSGVLARMVASGLGMVFSFLPEIEVFEEGIALVGALGGGVLAHEEGEVHGGELPEDVCEAPVVGSGGPFGNGQERTVAGEGFFGLAPSSSVAFGSASK